MTVDADKLCSAYDQIADRRCRYYAGHGGKHNFARLDHDCRLERELRRDLDEMTKGLAEALELADEYSTMAIDLGGFGPKGALERLEELRKLLPP